MEYEELRLRIWPAGPHGRNRYLALANGPEPAAALLRFHRSPQEYWGQLNQLFQEEFGVTLAPAGPNTSERLRELGRELFSTVLPPCMRDAILRSQALAAENGKRLRLRLEVRLGLEVSAELSAELSELPFEILCSPAGDPLKEIVLQGSLSLVRSLPGLAGLGLRLPQAEDRHQPLSILVAVASPHGLDPLDLSGEIDRIQESLPPVLRALRRGRGPVTLLGWPRDPNREPARRVTCAHLRHLVERTQVPSILVLAAHGGYDEKQGGVVYLERDDGSPDPVSSGILSGLLAGAPGLRLVVLSLCLGARAAAREPYRGLAQGLIAGGIPAVIAMQTEVSHNASAVFSPAVLWGICRNQTIDEAVAAGRLAMAGNRDNSIEWCSPVVYLHERCKSGWLFKVLEAVLEGEELPDALRDASRLLARIEDAPPVVEELPAAIAVLQREGDWQRVTQFAEVGLDKKGDDLTFQRLRTEARIEICIDRLSKLVDRLASEGSPDGADRELAGLRGSLPPSVYRPLKAELDQALELDRLYCAALEHEEERHWQAAVRNYDAILALRPEGYRAAECRRKLAQAYSQAEQALQAERWQAAMHLFLGISKLAPEEDLARHGRRYALGRYAEDRGRWLSAARALGGVIWDDDPALPGRLGYAKGRAAEEREEWALAAAAFGHLQEDFRDARLRLLYSRGRAAEESGDWDGAAEAFGLLLREPPGRLPWDDRDLEQRRLYACGMQAEKSEDWEGVITGFGSLPDDYRDVGWRRRHARARLAESREDWALVVETLSQPYQARLAELREDRAHVVETLFEPHQGELQSGLARLLNYARGRLAELRQDWKGALAAFLEVDGGYSDLLDWQAYTRGRDAEKTGDWPAAVEALTSLREDFKPNHKLLVVYSRGRWAEDEGDWARAESHYSALAAHFEDSAARLPYARAKRALEQGQWGEALATLAEAPAIRDAIFLMAYAQGRLAEQAAEQQGAEHEHWATAADHFGRCAGRDDADERQAYARGRWLEAEGRWSAALTAYHPLPDTWSDIAERRQRLQALLVFLPWLDGLAAAGLVADSLASETGAAPYELLRSAGVTPSSSAETVKEASFALMEQGAMTAEARRAWDEVRTVEGRLVLDAFLYRLSDPAALKRLQTMLPASGADEIRRELCEGLPDDAPLFRLLAGRREEAIRDWELLLRQSPHKGRVVHALGLAAYWQARHLEAGGAYELAERAWQTALANWGRTLCDDGYWEGWRRERAERYGLAISSAQVASLRRQLVQRLERDLLTYAEDLGERGRRERSAVYRRLALALDLESDAAQILGELGGVPFAQGGQRPLVCGPLYLRQEALEPQLARMVAFLDSEQRQGQPAEPPWTPLDTVVAAGAAEGLFRLRCAFSDLGPALFLLGREQPQAALQALPELYRLKLAELPADCETAAAQRTKPHLAACEHCQAFLDRSPAYLHLPHRTFRRHEDAVALAVRACLALAQAALVAEREARGEVLRWWREAVTVAQNAGAQVRTKQVIARAALGRAEALRRAQGRGRGRSLTDALELLDEVSRLVGPAGGIQLQAKAAELLAQRGVWLANDGGEQGRPDYQQAAEDLRHALVLNPESLHAQVNFSRALVCQASNLDHDHQPERALRLFSEALSFLHEGLRRSSDHHQLQGEWSQVLAELEEWALFALSREELMARIRARPRPGTGASTLEPPPALAVAAEAQSEGDFTGALIALIEAGRRHDHNAELRQALVDLLVDRAAQPTGHEEPSR